MPIQSLRDLTHQFRGAGRVEAIFLRPARLAPVVSVAAAQAEPGRGLKCLSGLITCAPVIQTRNAAPCGGVLASLINAQTGTRFRPEARLPDGE